MNIHLATPENVLLNALALESGTGCACLAYCNRFRQKMGLCREGALHMAQLTGRRGARMYVQLIINQQKSKRIVDMDDVGY